MADTRDPQDIPGTTEFEHRYSQSSLRPPAPALGRVVEPVLAAARSELEHVRPVPTTPAPPATFTRPLLGSTGAPAAPTASGEKPASTTREEND